MIALDNGDKIRGDAAAATVVDYTLHGSVGTTITQLADGQLASSIGDLYTAGAADIAVHSIVLVNTDTVARTVNLYLTPSGGTARRLIPKNTSLDAGYSLMTDGDTLSVFNTSGELLTSGGTGPASAGQLFLSVAGGWPSTTNGCAPPAKIEFATNDIDMYLANFDDSSDEFIQWTVGMPSDYDGGTIQASFYWTANSTSTNSVVWGLQGRSFADDEAIDQAWGTAQTVTDANKSTAYDKNITALTSAITIGGTPAGSELVQFRAYRDADNGSDNLSGDAGLVGIMITFTRT